MDNIKSELNSIIDQKIDGYILLSKAQVIEEGERNSKYFASLEKKKAESKIISRLNIKDKIITDQKDIINEEKSYYKNLFSKKDLKHSSYNIFDDNIDKLDVAEQHICDGILTEHELAIALKEMKNQTSSPKGNDAHLRALYIGSRYYACP